MRSIAPGLKFCRKTSAVFSSSLRACFASSLFRSRQIDFFPRLQEKKPAVRPLRLLPMLRD